MEEKYDGRSHHFRYGRRGAEDLSPPPPPPPPSVTQWSSITKYLKIVNSHFIVGVWLCLFLFLFSCFIFSSLTAYVCVCVCACVFVRVCVSDNKHFFISLALSSKSNHHFCVCGYFGDFVFGILKCLLFCVGCLFSSFFVGGGGGLFVNIFGGIFCSLWRFFFLFSSFF